MGHWCDSLERGSVREVTEWKKKAENGQRPRNTLFLLWATLFSGMGCVCNVSLWPHLQTRRADWSWSPVWGDMIHWWAALNTCRQTVVYPESVCRRWRSSCHLHIQRRRWNDERPPTSARGNNESIFARAPPQSLLSLSQSLDMEKKLAITVPLGNEKLPSVGGAPRRWWLWKGLGETLLFSLQGLTATQHPLFSMGVPFLPFQVTLDVYSPSVCFAPFESQHLNKCSLNSVTMCSPCIKNCVVKCTAVGILTPAEGSLNIDSDRYLQKRFFPWSREGHSRDCCYDREELLKSSVNRVFHDPRAVWVFWRELYYTVDVRLACLLCLLLICK